MNAITPATMMAISAGISAGGQIIQGRAASYNAKLMQERYESEKQVAELEGIQAELQRRRETDAILANNRAVKGASGVGESRSFMAIQNDIEDILYKDLASLRMNTNKIKTGLDRAIFNEKQESYYSNVGAVLGASTTIIDGVAYHDHYKKDGEARLGTKLKNIIRRS